MAMRLERSGGLIFIHGAPEEPQPPKRNKFTGLGLWLALVILVIGVLFIGPHSLSLADVGHTVKNLLAAVH